MFRFDMEINAWVPLNYEATYMEPITVHGDSLDEFPDGAEVTPIVLTEEQTARLSAVRGDTTITLEDLMTYVLHGDDVPHKLAYDKEAAMASVIEQLPDEVIEANLETLSDSFPPWRKNVPYKAGAHVTHYGGIYKVLQAHTSQEDWTPDLAPSLFATLLTSPTGEALEWVQPGSANPYMKGDRVIFEGKVYESLIDDNIWSPTEYPQGWKEESPAEGEEPPVEGEEDGSGEVEPWKQPAGGDGRYVLGAIVSHKGETWVSVHDGLNVWEPGQYGWELKAAE